MLRLRPIHFAAQKRLSRGFLHVAEASFWFVLALSLGLCGRTALSGLPVMAEYLSPAHWSLSAPSEPYHTTSVANLPMTEPHTVAGEADTVAGGADTAAGGADTAAGETNAVVGGADASVGGADTPQYDPSETANAAAEFGQRGHAKATAPGRAPEPAIALVMDDLGPDVARTRRTMNLPETVALSFLPYGAETPALAVAAGRTGHDVLVHVPMQPLGRENPGPMVLMPGMSPREITRRLKWDLSRVPGAVGINNHMGSRFTQDRAGLIPVMRVLMYRNLFFFDSVTSPHSAGMQTAHAFGVLSARRDVFLDDEVSPAAIARQLLVLERVARHNGIALAIGHPHDATLSALEAWCAHLQGFRLVRIKAGLRMKTERDMGVPVAALSTAPAQ